MTTLLPTGFMKGFCLDENGGDIVDDKGETNKDGVETEEECAEWCIKQPVPLGCEYNYKTKRCVAHSHNVRWNNEDGNGLCSIIIPAGLGFWMHHYFLPCHMKGSSLHPKSSEPFWERKIRVQIKILLRKSSDQPPIHPPWKIQLFLTLP